MSQSHDDIEVVPIGPRWPNGSRDEQQGERALPGRLRQDQYEKVKLLTRSLLTVLGRDPYRDGLRRTPERMARMYGELLAGYDANVEALIDDALFDVAYEEMIAVRQIDFFSLCEHHLLPFFGQAHVAYVPGERVIGLSRIPDIVEVYARRLQLQERLTQQVADQLEVLLRPRGLAVVVDATHLCTIMGRGSQQDARVRTSTMRGQFQEDTALRGEFVQHLQHGSAL